MFGFDFRQAQVPAAVVLNQLLTEVTVAYTLEQFCEDARNAMKADRDDGGREKVRDLLSKLLKEKDFIAKYCSPDHKPGTTLLYRDPELDFRVLAHCFKGGTKSPPHDHGTSWAVYGQAIGHTNVQVWRRKDGAKGDKQTGPAELEKIATYELNQGDAGVFHPGIVHTVEFTPGSRYIRVTGTDLNRLVQGIYDLEKHTVAPGNPGAHIDATAM
jgi:predicted metal-dependent enzyme (double-stranded beta helix superfamily)